MFMSSFSLHFSCISPLFITSGSLYVFLIQLSEYLDLSNCTGIQEFISISAQYSSIDNIITASDLPAFGEIPWLHPRGIQHTKKRHDLVFGIKYGWEIDFYTSEVFPVSGYSITI